MSKQKIDSSNTSFEEEKEYEKNYVICVYVWRWYETISMVGEKNKKPIVQRNMT